MTSERSLDELKVVDDLDLPEGKSRSLTRAAQQHDECYRDSGIDRSNLAYGLTSNDDDIDDNDDDNDDVGLMKIKDKTTSNGLAPSSVKPRSPPADVSQTNEPQSKVSITDSVKRLDGRQSSVPGVEMDGTVLETLAEPDIETSPGNETNEALSSETNHHDAASSVPGRTSSTEPTSTSPPGLSSSGMATSNSEATDSEATACGVEDSTSDQSTSTPGSVDLPTTSLAVTVSAPVRSSSSTPEILEPPKASVSLEVSARTPSTTEVRSVTVGNLEPSRTESVAPRLVSTIASTPGAQDLPRSVSAIASTIAKPGPSRSVSTVASTPGKPNTPRSVTPTSSTPGKPDTSRSVLTTSATPSKQNLPRSISTISSTSGKQGLPRSVSNTASASGKPDTPRSMPATASTPGKADPPRRRVVMNPEFLRASGISPRPRKAPVFIRKMRDVKVLAGETARFEVRLDGNPTPAVTWLKNGVELTIDKCKYSVETVGGRWFLVVSDCTEDDVAEYGCTAVNDLGNIISTSRLFVEPSGTGKN